MSITNNIKNEILNSYLFKEEGSYIRPASKEIANKICNDFNRKENNSIYVIPTSNIESTGLVIGNHKYTMKELLSYLNINYENITFDINNAINNFINKINLHYRHRGLDPSYLNLYTRQNPQKPHLVDYIIRSYNTNNELVDFQKIYYTKNANVTDKSCFQRRNLQGTIKQSIFIPKTLDTYVGKDLIICEGVPDTLTYISAGYNAIGVISSALTDKVKCQIGDFLTKITVKNIYISFDEDAEMEWKKGFPQIISKYVPNSKSYFIDVRDLKPTIDKNILSNVGVTDIKKLDANAYLTYVNRDVHIFKANVDKLLKKSKKEDTINNLVKYKFWEETYTKTGKLRVNVNASQLYDYLKSLGVRSRYTSSDVYDKDKHTKVELVIEKNNILVHTDMNHLRGLVKDYVEKIGTPDVVNEIAKKIHLLINESQISYYFNKRVNYTFSRDTEDKAFFYYKNGFVEITKYGAKFKDYKELEGVIWSSQIIPRNYNKNNKLENYDLGVFYKFAKNVCSSRDEEGKIVVDSSRFQSLCHTLGYLLHSYKNPSYSPAVIFTENNTDLDDAKGGTGKGLLMQGIRELRNVSVLDGRSFTFDSQFAFQTIDLDTNVMFFDDVNPAFNFGKLYSILTEGLSIEKKNKHRIKLKFDESPKIAVSSNFSIIDDSGSAQRRKFEMELSCYYSKDYTPEEEFGHHFFSSWRNKPDDYKQEWDYFDSFMHTCVHLYLYNNSKISAYQSDSILEKKLINATGKDFVQFMGTINNNTEIECSVFYRDFIRYAGYYDTDKDKPSKTRVGKWLKYYARSAGKNLEVVSKRADGKVRKFYKL